MIDRFFNSFYTKEDYYNRGGRLDWHIGSDLHTFDKLTTLLCLFELFGRASERWIRNWLYCARLFTHIPKREIIEPAQKNNNFVICRDLFLNAKKTTRRRNSERFIKSRTHKISTLRISLRENLIKRKFHHLPLWLCRMSSSRKSKSRN